MERAEIRDRKGEKDSGSSQFVDIRGKKKRRRERERERVVEEEKIFEIERVKGRRAFLNLDQSHKQQQAHSILFLLFSQFFSLINSYLTFHSIGIGIIFVIPFFPAPPAAD